MPEEHLFRLQALRAGAFTCGRDSPMERKFEVSPLHKRRSCMFSRMRCKEVLVVGRRTSALPHTSCQRFLPVPSPVALHLDCLGRILQQPQMTQRLHSGIFHKREKEHTRLTLPQNQAKYHSSARRIIQHSYEWWQPNSIEDYERPLIVEYMKEQETILKARQEQIDVLHTENIALHEKVHKFDRDRTVSAGRMKTFGECVQNLREERKRFQSCLDRIEISNGRLTSETQRLQSELNITTDTSEGNAESEIRAQNKRNRQATIAAGDAIDLDTEDREWKRARTTGSD
ncbi:hypothetical protein WAI453_012688 [Rhynchosporium graminicola]